MPTPTPIPAGLAFLFTADSYGQPLRIQYVDGALWFVQTDLQAVLHMRLRAPLERVPDADGFWKFERLDGVEEALLSERALSAILGCAQGVPTISRFAIWLSAQLPKQVRAAVAEHRALAVASQPVLPAVVPRQPAPVMTVAFYGSSHPVLTHEGKPYVAMKSVVEALGLQWEAQLKRIKRNQVLAEGMSMMDIPSVGGVQEGACLRLDLLNGWLFGVEVNRVRPELRERLLGYQRECYRVLWQHWQERVGPATVSGSTAAPVSVLATRQPGDPVEIDALSPMEMFLALQLTFSNNPAAAKLMWALLRFGAHRVPLRMSACELHRRIGGMIERSNINTTARKLRERGLVEFSPGRYRVLEPALGLELVAALDAAAEGLGVLLADAISASVDMALPEPVASGVRRLH